MKVLLNPKGALLGNVTTQLFIIQIVNGEFVKGKAF